MALPLDISKFYSQWKQNKRQKIVWLGLAKDDLIQLTAVALK